MHEVRLATLERYEPGGVPVAGGGVVGYGDIGAAQGQRARARAQAQEFAGIAGSSVGGATGAKQGDGE